MPTKETLYVRISPDLMEHLDRVRARVGKSKAAYISELLRHDMTTVDSRGVPAWWTAEGRQAVFPFDQEN